MGIKASIALLMVTVAVAGCTRSTSALNVNTRPPQPLPSVPSGDVQSAQLDPISENAAQQPGTATQDPLQAPTAPSAPGADDASTTEVASLDTSAATSSEPLTHEPLAGSWNVASDSSQCRAILAFTKWSGGYRATTLRCNSPELSTVTAWDVKGPLVVLVDANGNQVASLGSAGNERYAGTTASGKPITFSR